MVSQSCTGLQFHLAGWKVDRVFPFMNKLEEASPRKNADPNAYEQCMESISHFDSAKITSKACVVGGSLFKASGNALLEVNSSASMVDSNAKSQIRCHCFNRFISRILDPYWIQRQIATDQQNRHERAEGKETRIAVESKNNERIQNKASFTQGFKRLKGKWIAPMAEQHEANQTAEKISAAEHGTDDFVEDASSFPLYKEEAMPEVLTTSNTMKRTFPPLISILRNASRPDLPSHIVPRVFWRAVKRDGRFVLQEEQARPREVFQAIRENGRLKLQLIWPDGKCKQVGNELKQSERPRTTAENVMAHNF